MTVNSSGALNNPPLQQLPLAEIAPPAAKATAKQQAPKAIKASSGKSKWYEAINKFIKDTEASDGQFAKPYPKVRCRYLKSGEHIVSDVYTDDNNVKKLGFRVAWEVEFAPGKIYSTDTTGTITKEPTLGTIPGFDGIPMVFTEIQDPDTKSAHVMLNCERMALGIAKNLTKVIEFALNPLDSTEAGDIESRNNIISYLSRNNFVGSLCKNGLGKVVSVRNEDDTFKDFDKIRMVPLIFGKETNAPHTKGPWTQTAKIAQRTFIQQFSEEAQFDKLSPDRKKLYMHRQYLSLTMENAHLLETHTKDLETQKKIMGQNELALREIEDLRKNPGKTIEANSALGKWLTENPNVNTGNASLDTYQEHLTSQLRTAKSAKEAIETRFTDHVYNELKTFRDELFIPQFASLDSKQINEFADFVQQELADTLQCYFAFYGFFDGSSPLSQMTNMFDDKLRPISPRAQELATVQSTFGSRFKAYMDKELLNETMVMTPGLPKMPFLPVKPVVSILKGLSNLLIPNRLKNLYEQSSTIKLQSLEQTNHYVENPAVRQGESADTLRNDKNNLISHYYDSLHVMEKLEQRMENLKTLNHAIHRFRVESNANNPLNVKTDFSKWFSSVTHGFTLQYPSDWDHAQFVMAHRNNIARHALESIRPQAAMTAIRADEEGKQFRRTQFSRNDNSAPI